MKKWFAGVLLVLAMSVCAALADGIILPAGLTAIEEDAFRDNTQLCGVLELPDGVQNVGSHAFTGTSIYALCLPEGADSLGTQAFNGAAYVLVRGSDTTVAALSGVHYLIAPQGSAVQAGGEAMLIAREQLVEQNGFFYMEDGGSLTLLCAADADAVGESVIIPAEIAGKPVTDAAQGAFIGLNNVKKMILPAALRQSVTQEMLENCPYASLRYDDEGPIVVRSVTADAQVGEEGNTITWTVDAAAENGVSSYAYTLTLDGQTIHTSNSQHPSFTYAAKTAGAYQLAVAVTDQEGYTARGVSDVLYIAGEILKMTVPESLEAGEDLLIEVEAVEGATRYALAITNVQTKEAVSFITLTKAESRRIYGYLLDEGTYRVAGYVFGDDFQYMIPTVSTVRITGEKAAGPQIPQQEPLVLEEDDYVQLRLSETEPFVIRYWYEYSDGTTKGPWEAYYEGETARIRPPECEKVCLQGAIQQNGKWTQWSEVRAIDVIAGPALSEPEVTIPQNIQAGHDCVIHIGSVENADQYLVWFYEGEEPWGESIFFESASKAGDFTIPGYCLSAGTYCLRVSVRGDGYTSCERSYLLKVTGTQPAAPTLSADKTEVYAEGDTLTVTVLAPGAEGAYLDGKAYSGGSTRSWGDDTISLDENGRGTYSQSHFGSDLAGYTYQLKVAAIIDGVWSEFAVLELPIVETPPLAEPVVTMPSTLVAGQDLVFSVVPVENAQTYSAEIRRSYDSGSFYSWDEGELKAGQNMTLPGYELSQGNYVLEVSAHSSGLGSSTVSMPLTVTGTKPAAPTITADRDECHIKEKITFSIDTAGADKVCIDHESTWLASGNSRYAGTNERTATGDLTQWSYTFREDALNTTFTFRFSVLRDGLWSAWKSVERTVLDLPPLDAPVIHAQPFYQAGEDISITFDAVEHAEEYEIRLYDEQTGDDFGTTIKQPEARLYAGCDYEPGKYRLEVTAESSVYKNTTATAEFEIVGAKPAAPQVSVDKTRAAKGEKYTFTIDTAGAQAACYRYKESDENYWNNGNIHVLEDSTKWSTYRSSAGVYKYGFSVFRDGRWTQWSEPIAIMIDDSTMPTPTVTMPATLSAGQDLTVTVAPVSGMTSCYVYLYNSYGTQLGYRYMSGESGGTVTFNGYLFSPGTYRVKTQVYGGSDSSETSANITVTSGERPAAPAVSAQTDTSRVNVKYGFTIDTEGAESVAVRYYREGNTGSVYYETFGAAQTQTRWEDANSTAGETWRYAFSVKRYGVWSPWSSTCAVYITNREMLDQVTLNVPSSIEAGEDIVVSFEGVTNADSYTLYLYHPDGDYNSYTVYPGVERRFAGYDFEPGTYRVVVRASGAQYAESQTQKEIVVTGSRPAAPQVTMDKDEVYTEEVFTFMIDSSAAQEIAYQYTTAGGGRSSGRLDVLTSQTAWETYGWNSTIYSYSFSVPRDDKWSAWSDPLQVTVKPRAPLAQPQFSAPTELEQGRDLTVSVSGVEDATYYYVNLYDKYGENFTSRHLSAAGDAVFQGYQLPLGQVRIEVEACNNVGGHSETVGSVNIVQSQRAAAPSVTPQSTSAVRGDHAVFTLDTAGAQQAAARIYRVGAPNNVWYETFDTSGDTTTYSDYLSYSDCTYAYSFAVKTDGVWSQWSDFVEIEIE